MITAQVILGLSRRGGERRGDAERIEIVEAFVAAEKAPTLYSRPAVPVGLLVRKLPPMVTVALMVNEAGTAVLLTDFPATAPGVQVGRVGDLLKLRISTQPPWESIVSAGYFAQRRAVGEPDVPTGVCGGGHEGPGQKIVEPLVDDKVMIIVDEQEVAAGQQALKLTPGAGAS